MKRRTLAAIALVACASSPIAYSTSYLNVGGGYVVPNESRNTIVNSNNVFYSPTVAEAGIFQATNVNWRNNFNNGYELFAALGVDWTEQSRIEGELLFLSVPRNIQGNYTWQQVTTIGGDIFATQPNNRISRSKSTLYSYSLLGNIYYDFRNKTRWTPYIGAGIGIGRVHAGGTTVDDTLLINNLTNATSVVTPTTEHTPALNGIVFVWQLKAGLVYAISPKLALTGQYRLFRTSNYNINSGSITTNPGTAIATTYSTPSKTISGLLNNSIDAGLIYTFG